MPPEALLLLVFALATAIEVGTDGATAPEFRVVGGALVVALVAICLLARRAGTEARRALAHRLRLHQASQAALAENEERLRLAQELVGMGTWDVDLSDGTAVWSESLRDLYGVADDARTGFDAFLALVHPDDRGRVERTISRAIATRAPYEQEFRLRRADGATLWLLSRGRALYDAAGRPTRLTGVAMDITQRREADERRAELELRLRQAHRLEALGRLAGGIAHDFNNLLLGVRGHGELAISALERGRDPSPNVLEMLAGANRAAGLTAQLLAFGRRQVLEPAVLDLGEIVAEMEKLLRPLIGEQVELTVIAGAEPVHVVADRSQVEQVIVNLALNGRDAMPDGGRLTLRVDRAEVGPLRGPRRPSAPAAMLTVSDTGEGMDAETAARIFEPFFTTKMGGSGLGLATVHGIVTQSGGSISVDSEPGHGTTFAVFLPATEEPEPVDTPAREGSSSAAAENGETILLIEDDPQVRDIVRCMLESHGYGVHAAAGGEEALALARAPDVRIDLVLSDLIVPGGGGRQVVAQVRDLRPDARILYMSGYTDDVVFRGGAPDGAAFLQKPFGSDELASRVRDLLDRAPRSLVASTRQR